jgi:formylglycine-generating enzyme required for sulfatase activity
MKKTIFLQGLTIVVLVMVLSFNGFSNNVRIANAIRTGVGRDLIQFDLSWDNSWMVTGVPCNHDAVWVFIKFRPCTGGDWQHALLSTTMTDHTFAAGVTYAKPILTTDRWGNAGNFNNGVMVRRNSVGTGNIANQTISLRVVGSTLGVILDPATEYDIKVFAIEMVQILQGNFQAGDGASTYAVYNPTLGSSSTVNIASENAININNNVWSYIVPVPADFPKGFSEFYIMKYEITHGQYCDFLNSVSGAASVSRYYNIASYMHDLQFSGVYYSNSNDRPINYLSAQDVFAYLDWAALRPITELEFEKACRGPLGGVQEYAWGTTTIIHPAAMTGANAGVEYSTTLNANAAYNNTIIVGGQFGAGNRGPVAAGCYARDTTTTRATTGASYYGVMELSGNVAELTIRINRTNSTTPSNYTGLWGDGHLDPAGLHDVINWPYAPDYIMYRGGGFPNGPTYMRISDRNDYTNNNHTIRSYNYGGRGAR